MAIIRFVLMFALVFFIPFTTLWMVGSMFDTTVSEQLSFYKQIFDVVTSITTEQFFMFLFIGFGGMLTVMPIILIFGCSCNHKKNQ